MSESQNLVTVDVDALRRLLASDRVRDITNPRADAQGSVDLSIRMAEFWEVVDIVRAATGRTFASEEEAGAVLFDGAQGGGFGIREWLRAEVLNALTRASSNP